MKAQMVVVIPHIPDVEHKHIREIATKAAEHEAGGSVEYVSHKVVGPPMNPSAFPEGVVGTRFVFTADRQEATA